MGSCHTTQPSAERDESQSAFSAAQRAHEAAQQEIDRHMERLLTIASHELRTPLTAINGNVQLALRRLSSDESGSKHTVEAAHELLSRATRQLDRLNNLIERMLHAECIHEGKLKLHIARCNLVDVISEITEQYRLLWPTRTITITPSDIARRTTSIYVAADVDHIAQVIANYLSNALKFSRDEAPVVLLVEPRADHVRIAVRDEGPGLPHDEHDRVWERFHRVPDIPELSGSGIGFGVGLYISREIARQHGGQVGVESAPEKGSTFWCTLPLLSADAQPPGNA